MKQKMKQKIIFRKHVNSCNESTSNELNMMAQTWNNQRHMFRIFSSFVQ